MKKILFTLLASSYLLLANALPNAMTTTISNVTSNGEVELSSSIPAGMSGIIIHNYGNKLVAITHSTTSLGGTKASTAPYQAILHENIPNIKTEVKKGDKVIFGNFYQNALVIAPNQEVYRTITKNFKRSWVHPDLYALAFMKDGETKLSLDHLHDFAQHNQVGLVLISTQNALLILDPISKQFLGSIPMQPNSSEAMAPFYARFKQMDISTFGFSNKSYTPYYESVAGVQ